MTDPPLQSSVSPAQDPARLREDVRTGTDPSDIADDLGPALATLANPDARRRPVERVVIADTEQPATIRQGDVILGIGVLAHGPGLLNLVRTAGTAQASAVILRSAGPLGEDAVAEASAGDLAVITVDPRLPWERIYSLVHASIGSRARGPHEGADGEIPLGNMFELASALSHLVGGPTILEDAYFRVIGYSAYAGESDPGRQAAILLRHIPPQWLTFLRSQGVLDRLRQTEDVILLEYGPLAARRRLITSVRSAGELIGIIWVAEGDRPLDESSVERLRQARPITVPHFQRYLATERLGSSRRSELLSCLIEGRGGADRVAGELGLEPASDYCLIAAFPAGTEKRAATVADRELFAAHLEYYDRATSNALVGDTLYGLVPVSRPGDRDRLKAIAERLAAGGSDHGLAVVALSSPQPVTGYLTEAQQELHTLLVLVPRHAEERLVIAGWEYEAAILAKRAQRLLGADQRFKFRKLTALEAYDARAHSALVDTLAEYLCAGSSISGSARVLQIHHTTLRYRLRRIVDLSGLALDDPAERLAAQLHLLASGRWPGI